MKEYIKFFRDKSLLTALAIIVCAELAMQAGCYQPFLKKNSYAANVYKLTGHVLKKQIELDPEILIMGTSLAYEGLSVPILNQKLQALDLKAQSIAVRGAELVVQGMVLEKVLQKFTKVKYLVHVNEIERPWLANRHLTDYTLSMLAQLDRQRAWQRILEDAYNYGSFDRAFLASRLVAYRRDMGNLMISFDKRLKDFGKQLKEKRPHPYYYENQYRESLSLYKFATIEECLQKTTPFSPIPAGSDRFHRNAIFKTCNLAGEVKLDKIEKSPVTDLYFKRIDNLYRIIRDRNIQIINVFPPLPKYLEKANYPARIAFWQKEYGTVLGNKVIDLFACIPRENNADYYYDLIHLNALGMKLFSEQLGERLLQEIKKDREL
ncbi:MAG: SGNH/GDSL hydrolase family protein [Spirochaetota bacterium]